MNKGLLFLGLILVSAVCLRAEEAPPKPTLTIYMFEQLVGVPGKEVTNIVSASPTGDFSVYNFGNFAVSDHVLRETDSPTSRIIGRGPGWFSPNKEKGNFNLLNQLTLKTEKFRGSLVVSADFYETDISTEFAILGGTGTFRRARGYCIATLIDGSLEHLTYRWDIYVDLQIQDKL